jgi:hypothetical protein
MPPQERPISRAAIVALFEEQERINRENREEHAVLRAELSFLRQRQNALSRLTHFLLDHAILYPKIGVPIALILLTVALVVGYAVLSGTPLPVVTDALLSFITGVLDAFLSRFVSRPS